MNGSRVRSPSSRISFAVKIEGRSSWLGATLSVMMAAWAVPLSLSLGGGVLLDDDSLKHWLAPDVIDRESIRSLVRHINAVLIEHWPVNTSINKPAEGQGSELINPA